MWYCKVVLTSFDFYMRPPPWSLRAGVGRAGTKASLRGLPSLAAARAAATDANAVADARSLRGCHGSSRRRLALVRHDDDFLAVHGAQNPNKEFEPRRKVTWPKSGIYHFKVVWYCIQLHVHIIIYYELHIHSKCM